MSKTEPNIVNTYVETSADLVEEYLESSKRITLVTYWVIIILVRKYQLWTGENIV